jgi:hypothetical protein
VNQLALGDFLETRPDLLPDYALTDPQTTARALNDAVTVYERESARERAELARARNDHAANAHADDMRKALGSSWEFINRR